MSSFRPALTQASAAPQRGAQTQIRNRRKRSENEQQALNTKDSSMNSHCVQAEITRLLREQKINPGG